MLLLKKFGTTPGKEGEHWDLYSPCADKSQGK
jgi:hypothetical protein